MWNCFYTLSYNYMVEKTGMLNFLLIFLLRPRLLASNSSSPTTDVGESSEVGEVGDVGEVSEVGMVGAVVEVDEVVEVGEVEEVGGV